MNKKIIDMLVIGVVVVILIFLATFTMGTKVYEGFEEMHKQEPHKSFFETSLDKIKRIFINAFIYLGLMSPDSMGDDNTMGDYSMDDYDMGSSSPDLENNSRPKGGYGYGGSMSGIQLSKNGVFEAGMPGRPMPRSGMPMPRSGMPMPERGMPMPGSGMPMPERGMQPPVQSLVPQTTVTSQPKGSSSTQSPGMMSSQPAKIR